jgi:hypothetical protein
VSNTWTNFRLDTQQTRVQTASHPLEIAFHNGQDVTRSKLANGAIYNFSWNGNRLELAPITSPSD